MNFEITAPTKDINLIEQIMFENDIKTSRPPGRLAIDGIARLIIELNKDYELGKFCGMLSTLHADGLIKIGNEP